MYNLFLFNFECMSYNCEIELKILRILTIRLNFNCDKFLISSLDIIYQIREIVLNYYFSEKNIRDFAKF